MSNDLVEVERTPPIAMLTLRRVEKRNALSMDLRDAIERALDALAFDDAIRAVVLTGGPEVFSAGFDMDEMVATDLRALFHRGVEFTEQTYFFPKPLVTAVGGAALGGGFDLALSGDVIVATEEAVLGRPEIGWGINPLMTKLWHRIGMTRALQISLRGEKLTASAALAAGIVDRVVPRADLRDAARAEARRFADAAPLSALMATKRAARAIPQLEAKTAIAYEFGISAELAAEGTLKTKLTEYAARVRKR